MSKESPIIFMREMVQAYMAGRKNQTRRVMKYQPERLESGTWRVKDSIFPNYKTMIQVVPQISHLSPYGIVGDHLYIREAFKPTDIDPSQTTYAADIPDDQFKMLQGIWKPSIHMHKWRSRFRPKIISLRIERLQDISKSDAIAEGLVEWFAPGSDQPRYGINIADIWESDPRLTFKRLWDKANKGRGFSWQANPFVWVIEISAPDMFAENRPSR